MAGVLSTTTAGVEDERSWPSLLLAGVTAAFLAALVLSLAVDPMLWGSTARPIALIHPIPQTCPLGWDKRPGTATSGYLPPPAERRDAMDREFSNDDRNKEVVTSDGHRVGTVRDVDGDRVTVDRDDDEGLTDKVKEMLGWDDDSSNELHREHVGTVEDERILLRDQR